MESGKQRSRLAALSLIVLGASLRLIPHPPNFAPIGGIGLFGGMRLNAWQAYLVPLLAMMVTDPILSHIVGFSAYSWMTPGIYLSLMVYVFLGRTFLTKSQSVGRIALVCLLGSTQFFLITNFFSWLSAEVFYPHTVAGLIACYVAALPFFGRTVLGDLFYTAVLNIAFLLIARRLHTRSEAGHA